LIKIKLPMIKNKKKQAKTIEKLNLIRSMYNNLKVITYREEREKLIKGEDSEVRHSSEDAETFEDRRSEKIEGCLLVYNKLNEKLPHHIRLDLLD